MHVRLRLHTGIGSSGYGELEPWLGRNLEGKGGCGRGGEGSVVFCSLTRCDGGERGNGVAVAFGHGHGDH